MAHLTTRLRTVAGITLFLLLFTLTLGAGQGRAAELEKATLRLNHLPWGMHIPIFVALEKGYYQEEGLDLTVNPGHGAQEAITLVGSGREDLGLGTVDVFLVAREKGVPIVAFAMDMQKNPAGIFFLKSSGIQSPKDLEGRSIAQPPASSMKFIIPAALKIAGVDLDKVHFVDAPAGSEIQLMIAGKIDTSVGFTMGQPITLRDRGYEADYFSLADFGLDLYGTLFFTNVKTLQERPEVIERFLRGTLRGAIYAYQHVAEATQLLLKHRPDRGPSEGDKFKIIALENYRNDVVREHGWGWMTDEGWVRSMQVLLDTGMMSRKLAVDTLYTNEFLARVPEARTFGEMLFTQEPKD